MKLKVSRIIVVNIVTTKRNETEKKEREKKFDNVRFTFLSLKFCANRIVKPKRLA